MWQLECHLLFKATQTPFQEKVLSKVLILVLDKSWAMEEEEKERL